MIVFVIRYHISSKPEDTLDIQVGKTPLPPDEHFTKWCNQSLGIKGLYMGGYIINRVIATYYDEDNTHLSIVAHKQKEYIEKKIKTINPPPIVNKPITKPVEW